VTKDVRTEKQLSGPATSESREEKERENYV